MKNLRWIVTIVLLTGIGCAKNNVPKTNDLYYDTFFLKARFIMNNYEIERYKSLLDNKSREEFIKEFWLKRDPTPESEANENKEEFDNRIAYANKFFREGRLDMGWNTLRGRIILQLGIPDKRETDQYPLNSSSNYVPAEIWYYVEYDLTLYFLDIDNSGKYELYTGGTMGMSKNAPIELISAIDQALATFDLTQQPKNKKLLKFSSEYKNDDIILSIPVNHILFAPENDSMKAEFNIQCYVFHNLKQVDQVKKIETILKNQDELLTLKKLYISIPYKLDKKGKFTFEIILEDVLNGSKFRTFLTVKN